MTAYLLTGPLTTGKTIVGKAANAIVHAPSANVAKRVASQHVSGMSPGYFANATATAVGAATNWAGWTLKCRIIDTDGSDLVNVSSVAASTMDTLAAAMVTALNATALLANAAYNSSTNVLSVAGASDNLGDKRLAVDLIPPGATKAVNSALGSIVQSGSAGAALTVALPADAYAVPAIIGAVKS